MMRDVVVFVIAAISFFGGYFFGKAHRHNAAAPVPVAAAPVVAAPVVAAPTAPAPAGVEKQPDTVVRQRVPVAGVPKGPANAPITIVQFCDFQCPFSARCPPTIDKLLKEYPGKIRFCVRHYPLPFHPDAPLAAEAAIAAESEGKFWEMHDKLIENGSNLSRSDLEKYAEELGLDMARFKRALDTRAYKVRVDQDLAAAAKAGARGTPAFYINGRYLSGAQPAEAFQEIIDEELPLTEKLLADGTPPDKLYDTLTASAATANKLR
jgi:protein-disulfide isomerase